MCYHDYLVKFPVRPKTIVVPMNLHPCHVTYVEASDGNSVVAIRRERIVRTCLKELCYCNTHAELQLTENRDKLFISTDDTSIGHSTWILNLLWEGQSSHDNGDLLLIYNNVTDNSFRMLMEHDFSFQSIGKFPGETHSNLTWWIRLN